MSGKKLKVGFYEFTGCAGDLLTLVHSEDQLLDILTAAEVVSFRLASSQANDALVDIAFIEGSITTTEQEEKLRQIRKKSRVVVALGTCAAFGGVQAMYAGNDNYPERFAAIYPKNFSIVKAVASKPLSGYVPVDYFIPGCPIDARLFCYNYTRLLRNLPVQLPNFPVCMECKWRENECLLLKNIPCIGPITRAGCQARCPTNNLPCVGCFGPIEDFNAASWEKNLLEKGFAPGMLEKKIRMFFGARSIEVLKQIKGTKQ